MSSPDNYDDEDSGLAGLDDDELIDPEDFELTEDEEDFGADDRD